ncbi:hypothetical protein FNV43_RR25481 [Rhamnella rubrinervis]|uniref:3-oxo-5-alpha-steroid 4-dehydrogenase C-terminal domain-containing protein n=1 Tax=Rhamnella rubrinervis TaxID=2594499 RepID=A0A8K0DSI2_9ROSA|nr:hypothetical protein FNV43_RR25481 [Rhamnella rubrinervis]
MSIMMMSLLLKLVFPAPPSLLINAFSVVCLLSSPNLGLSEKRGKQHLQYSKFWNSISQKSASTQTTTELPSRTGMLILYVPAFLAPLMSLVLFPHEDIRVILLSSALAIHFFKRAFEVLFVHKYSGGMVLDSVIRISSGYFLATTSMIYGQHLTQGLAEPAVDLKYYGVVLFLIGITGNFYHHYILSQLRRNGEKEYKIPKGGLFGHVICPHYLFEIIGFLGFSFISQTLHAFSIATGAIFYLLGRSCATRRWYISKFEDFPQDVEALIPYVF